MMDVIKIPNFITEDECDDIIEEIKILAGARYEIYGIGKSYAENPLHSERIKEILWEKVKMVFGRRSYIQCWANILQRGMDIPPHVHREKGFFTDGTDASESHYFKEKFPFRCTNLFLGGAQHLGTNYAGVNHESKRGELHIFSSDLVHSVDKNNTGEARFSLVMDFMMTIGDGDWIKLT